VKSSIKVQVAFTNSFLQFTVLTSGFSVISHEPLGHLLYILHSVSAEYSDYENNNANASRYERVDELIWVKTNQLQRIIRTGRTGHWLNHGKEHCLVSTTALQLISIHSTPHINFAASPVICANPDQ